MSQTDTIHLWHMKVFGHNIDQKAEIKKRYNGRVSNIKHKLPYLIFHKFPAQSKFLFFFHFADVIKTWKIKQVCRFGHVTLHG